MNNNKEKMTSMLLPKGEWLDAMLVAFKLINLELRAQPRSYEYTFVNQAVPIVFQAIRSKEVVESIYDWDTTVNAGFTGSDVAVEQGVAVQQPRVWSFPINELNKDAPQPRVYLGSTPHLRSQVSQPTLNDLQGTTVYTEYPNITHTYLRDAGISARIKAVQGGSEGRWRIDERNGAVVSIRNTDATMRANGIDPIIDIMKAGILYIEGPHITAQDKLRADDLQELIYRALLSL